MYLNKLLIEVMLCACLGALTGNAEESDSAESGDTEEQVITTTKGAVKDEIETKKEAVNISEKLDNDGLDEEDLAE